jgi:hypothetical protein
MMNTKKCTRCKLPKLLNEFSIRTKSPDGRAYTCKACIKLHHSVPKVHTIVETKVCTVCKLPKPIGDFGLRRQSSDGHNSYCRLCKGRLDSQNYETHLTAVSTKNLQWKKENFEKARDSVKHSNARARMECLIYYSGDPPKCACCYESEIRFLTLDHINNNGKETRNVAKVLAFHLKKLGFPPGIQVLCYNCNCGRGANKGICPHQFQRVLSVMNA